MGDTVVLGVNRRRRGCGSVREEPVRAEVTVATSVELPTTGVAEVTAHEGHLIHKKTERILRS